MRTCTQATERVGCSTNRGAPKNRQNSWWDRQKPSKRSKLDSCVVLLCNRGPSKSVKNRQNPSKSQNPQNKHPTVAHPTLSVAWLKLAVVLEETLGVFGGNLMGSRLRELRRYLEGSLGLLVGNLGGLLERNFPDINRTVPSKTALSKNNAKPLKTRKNL